MSSSTRTVANTEDNRSFGGSHIDPITMREIQDMPSSVPSLCIPRVFPNITKVRVEAVFRKLDLGKIVRIDMVSRTHENGDVFKRVFIHLDWNRSSTSNQARMRLLSGYEIKVIYDDPWFWKISANRSHRIPPAISRSRVALDFGHGPLEPECLSRPRDNKWVPYKSRCQGPASALALAASASPVVVAEVASVDSGLVSVIPTIMEEEAKSENENEDDSREDIMREPDGELVGTVFEYGDVSSFPRRKRIVKTKE